MHPPDPLSPELASRLHRLIGAKVESYQPVQGGYTPALRLLCKSATARFFVKVGATPLTTQFLRREIHCYNAFRGDFMPHLIAYEDDAFAPILILEDLSAHHWPPPWDERRVALVLTQIDALHSTAVALETFAEVYGTPDSHWRAVAADPEPFLTLGLADRQWLDGALPLLIQYEDGCRTEGTHLTHLDLRSDNMCISAKKAIFVDWNLACLSNPKLDLGFWLPSLEYEGGPGPESILPDAPEVAAWVSGFFAARAGLPAIPDAPRVRVVQRQQLTTALAWAARALELSPLKNR